MFTDEEEDEVEDFINSIFSKYDKNSDGVYYDMEFSVNDIAIGIKDALKEDEEDE